MVAKTFRELTADTAPSLTRIIATQAPSGSTEPTRSTITEVFARIPERTLSSSGGTIGAADAGGRIICTATGTHTIAAAATLLGGFACEVVNDSGGSVILDGPGAANVTMAADEVAVVICCNSKIRVTKGSSTVTS